MNVDIEIYLSQFISFFDKNPDSLRELIGGLNKDEFYYKVKEQSIINHEKGEDVSLTRTQLIDVVKNLMKVRESENVSKKLNGIFQKTNFGEICLN